VRSAHEWFIRVVSGGAAGILPSAARAVFRAASTGYGLAVGARNRRYDSKAAAAWRAGLAVLSVGNLTTGGTGKTPLVETIVTELLERGWHPAIVTRGYVPRRRRGRPADEVEMLRRTVRAPVFAGADRIESLKRARSAGCDVAVLDDGFQRRNIARDFDILTVDALRPFGYGFCLPRGLLREPVEGAARADAIVVTRVESVGGGRVEKIEKELLRHAPEAVFARASVEPAQLNTSFGRQDPAYLRGRRVAAFCGIASPETFRGLVERIGAKIVFFRAFPDHWQFRDHELADLERQALDADAEILVTTRKDAARLAVAGDSVARTAVGSEGVGDADAPSEQVPKPFGAVPVGVVGIRLRLVKGAETFWERLFEAVENARDRLAQA